MHPEYQPKYKWRETWPGEDHQDVVSLDGDLQFGRIYLDLTSGSRARQWRWAINTIPWQRQNILPCNGWASGRPMRERHRGRSNSYADQSAAWTVSDLLFILRSGSIFENKRSSSGSVEP
ncbi:hypothetical protein [Rhizobium gallicum]|uniref:hypothetical protein n=1 Tax=Rhizobium gallicum TaxID=56730 RepID=UPI001EF81C2D|nr:hypothetical protein [Rhizobium gallicum]ULJ76255.1 hypothetical protein L2W42_27990 [Rhizobium gallicum]